MVTSWMACFSQPSLSQKESSDSLVSPVYGRKGNENFQSAKEYNIRELYGKEVRM